MITCSWKNWLSRITAWNSIINFNKSFLSHKPYFNPIFSSRRNNWNTIFLWIYSLPNSFRWINISDCSISNKLELWCDPFNIFWHGKAHVQTSINWNKDYLRFISRISNHNTFGWWSFFLSSFISSSCFFGCFFSFCDFCFSFLPFIESNYFWFWMQIFFINWQFCSAQCF